MGVDLAKLTLVVESNQVKSGTQTLQGLETQAKKTEAATGNLTQKTRELNTQYTSLGGTISRVLGLFAGSSLLGQSLRLAAIAEQQVTQFETLSGSQERAIQLYHELEQFGRSSPFKFQGLVDQVRLMVALGTNVDQAIPRLRILADTTAALGGNEELLGRIVLAFGQIALKGRVMAEEMRQLTEAGVPGWHLLAKALGTDVRGAVDLVEKRMVNADAAIGAMLAGLQEKYSGSIERLSTKTMSLFNQLRTAVTFTLRDIGAAIIESFDIQEKLQGLIVFTTNFGRLIADTARILGGLPPKFEENREAAEKLALAVRLLGEYLLIMLAIRVVTWLAAVTVGFYNAVTAALTFNNAIGLINASLKALVAGFVAFELGSYFADEFKIVAQVTSAFVAGMGMAWEHLKYHFNVVVALMKDTWSDFIKSLLSSAGRITSALAPVLNALPGGAALTGALATATTTLSAVGGILPDYDLDAAVAEIVEKRDRALEEQIRALDGIFDQIDAEFEGRSRKTGKSFFQYLDEDVGATISGLIDQAKTLTTDLLKIPQTFDAAAAKLGENPKFTFDNTQLLKPPDDSSSRTEHYLRELDLELTLIGKSNDERERAKDLLRFEEAAIKEFKNDWTQIGPLVDRYRIKLDQLQQARRLEKVAEGIGDAFADAFETAAFEATKFGDIMKDLFKSISKAVFNQLAAQPFSQALVGGLTGIFGSIFGVGATAGTGLAPGQYGPPIPNAYGNAFSRGSVVPFANGGIAYSPMMFPMSGGRTGLMGERKPEAIVPLARTTSGELGIQTVGNSSGPTVIFNISTPNPAAFGRSQGQFAAMAARAMQRASRN